MITKKSRKLSRVRSFQKIRKVKVQTSKRNDIFSFEFYVLRFEFSLKRKILKLEERQTIKNCCPYILECLQNFFFSKKKKKCWRPTKSAICDDSDEDCFSLDLRGAVTTSHEKWRFDICCRVNNVLTMVHMRTTSHCISTDELSQFRRSRDTLSSVSPPPDHHWASPSSWLDGFVTIPVEEGWKETRRIPTTLLKSTKFLFQCTQVFSALLIELGSPIVSVRKLHKHSLFSSTSSLVHSSSRAWFWMRSWLKSLDSYKKSSPPVTKSKNWLQTRSSHLHLVSFSLMMAMRRNNCTRLRSTIPCLQSPSAAPADLQKTMRDYMSSLSRDWWSWFACFSNRCRLAVEQTSGSLVTCDISSWQVRVKYRTDTQRSSPMPSETSDTTPIIQLWPPNRSSWMVSPVPETTVNCPPAQAPTIIIPNFVIHLSMRVCVQEIGLNCAMLLQCTTQTVSRSTQTRLVLHTRPWWHNHQVSQLRRWNTSDLRCLGHSCQLS